MSSEVLETSQQTESYVAYSGWSTREFPRISGKQGAFAEGLYLPSRSEHAGKTCEIAVRDKGRAACREAERPNVATARSGRVGRCNYQ